jgi:hypothetical protein
MKKEMFLAPLNSKVNIPLVNLQAEDEEMCPQWHFPCNTKRHFPCHIVICSLWRSFSHIMIFIICTIVCIANTLPGGQVLICGTVLGMGTLISLDQRDLSLSSMGYMSIYLVQGNHSILSLRIWSLFSEFSTLETRKQLFWRMIRREVFLGI